MVNTETKTIDDHRKDAGIDEVHIPSVRASLGMTQKEFAEKFGIRLSTLRNWEQNHRVPDGPAKTLLKVIAESPEAVLAALKERAPPLENATVTETKPVLSARPTLSQQSTPPTVSAGVKDPGSEAGWDEDFWNGGECGLEPGVDLHEAAGERKALDGRQARRARLGAEGSGDASKRHGNPYG